MIICFVRLHALLVTTYNELDTTIEMRDGFMIFPPQRQSRSLRPRNDFMFPNQGHGQMPTRNNPITGLLQQFMGPNQHVGQMATKGVDGLSKTLNGVQQFLRVVDTAAPLVKQYGPVVRNLPTMYRMMKAFKNLESADTDIESENIESSSLRFIESSAISNEESLNNSDRRGQSTPKLFI